MSEKRDFRDRSLGGSPAIRTIWRVFCLSFLAGAIMVTFPSESAAQGEQIQETALEQIRALMVEEAARSGSEMRLDSQLLLS